MIKLVQNVCGAIAASLALLPVPVFADFSGVRPKAPSEAVQEAFLDEVFSSVCMIHRGEITKEQSREKMKQYVYQLAEDNITLAELKYLNLLGKNREVRLEMKRLFDNGACS